MSDQEHSATILAGGSAMAQLRPSRPSRLLVKVGHNRDLLPVNISNDHVASLALPLIRLLRRLGRVLARLLSERRRSG